MKLDKAKVMVIYNTNASVASMSEEVADYYIAARELDATHKQGYDFGTSTVISSTTTPTYAAFMTTGGILEAIRSYISANNIEGVVLSTNLPHMGYFDETQIGASAYLGRASLGKIIGCSDYLFQRYPTDNTAKPEQGLSMGEVGVTEKVIDDFYGTPVTAGGNSGFKVVTCRTATGDYGNDPFAYDWRDSPAVTVNSIVCNIVPCGRLGYGKVTVTNDIRTEAKRMIDDAVWAESNVSPKTAPIVVGFSQRNGGEPSLAIGQYYAAYRLLVDAGISNLHTYEGNYDDAASSKYSAGTHTWPLPSISITNQVEFLSGNRATPLDVWGWIGAGHENNGTVYTGSVSFQRGAWMFEATSSAVSHGCLQNNGCAAVIPMQEPETAGIPETSGFVWHLLHGASMMEAELMSTGVSWPVPSEVHGDPLYTPFVNSGISRSKGILMSER